MTVSRSFRALAFAAAALLAACSSQAPDPAARPATRTVIFVWDGLRPDSVTAEDTPNLSALRQAGTWFADHHATYPTFTMMNAASIATGSFPATSGFYGNTLWTPPQGAAGSIPVGKTAQGTPADFTDPVFTEDWSILSALDGFYGGRLLLVPTLFETVQRAGYKTAAIGKSGPAFIQDLHRGGLVLDENTVAPQALAVALQRAGFALPANAVQAHAGGVTLAADNGNPTAQAATVQFTLPASVGTALKANDPSDASGAKATAANRYLFDVFLRYILPVERPDLSVVWLRDPDTTEHAYGPGSPNHRLALKAQDDRLGELLAALKAQQLADSTNVIVVSDHAHSTVSGSTALYPLRSVRGGVLGGIDPEHGVSVSGEVRSADLLRRAGFTHAYDGAGCLRSGLAGILADGTPVHPERIDATGAVCGSAGTPYQTPSYTVPKPLPDGAPGDRPIVVAANGGSDYFYVPSHDPATVQRLVTTLQQRLEFGAVFVDSRYGALPGSLPLQDIRLQNAERAGNGQPDVVASFAFDAAQHVHGVPGTEYASFFNSRGMHGSFSPIDVHNTLVAIGPSFKAGVTVTTPSGNVDVAPTVAALFRTALPHADGRVLHEGLRGDASAAPSVQQRVIAPATAATGLAFQSPADPSGRTVDPRYPQGRYSFSMRVKDLTVDGRSYRYFDSAEAERR